MNKETTPYKLRVDTKKCNNEGKSYSLISHALMGLIYHFHNRKWITGHSYLYIMKSYHEVEIVDEYIKVFFARLQEMGLYSYIIIEDDE